jgi:DNA-binding transcriptional LysR family regulator
MNLEPNDMLLFARVADEGSFSRAAQRVGLPKSTVSRRIATLETQLGERLLLRTTRKLKLTDFGHSVLAHAHQVADEVDAATSLAQQRQAEPSGRLRVTMPTDLANTVLADLLRRFIERYPAITLELDLTARRVDLIGENFDLALRMGALADDASLAARRVATFSVGLYASPRYLQRRGAPAEPEALMEHDVLLLLAANREPQRWVLNRGDERWEGLPPARAAANAPEFLLRLARQGVGIAAIADHFAAPHVTSGELAPVLNEWALPRAPAWAVFPGRRLMPSRTRVFIDALEAEFSGPRCQQAQQEVEWMKQRAPA